jgi:hypothetical protein
MILGIVFMGASFRQFRDEEKKPRLDSFDLRNNLARFFHGALISNYDKTRACQLPETVGGCCLPTNKITAITGYGTHLSKRAKRAF